VHPFVTSILLRAARLDALDLDAEAQPPHGELAQAEQRVRTGEGDAVVGANGLGQTELGEDALEDWEGEDRLGRIQRFATEQIAGWRSR
jgi:hypothetical protein